MYAQVFEVSSRVDLPAVPLHLGPMPGVALLKEILDRSMPSALRMLKGMVEINSYTENQEGVNRVGRLTAESFASLGFRSEFIPSTTRSFGDHLVLTRRGRSRRNIVMISHLDT